VSPVPRLDRAVLLAFSVCLAAACAVHVFDLWRHGWLPYRFAPLPLNAYWTALTLLDALAAVLLLCQPRAGLVLALLIIVSDVAINLFARFQLRLRLHPLMLSLQVLFLVALIAAIFHARAAGPATRTI
jgi:hypothetical protein